MDSSSAVRLMLCNAPCHAQSGTGESGGKRQMAKAPGIRVMAKVVVTGVPPEKGMQHAAEKEATRDLVAKWPFARGAL
jgi:hypothetical protein